jgi:hypothetical protein
MFQPAVVVVNAELVQLPFCWGDAKRTRAGPAAAVVVDPPAAVVVVDPPAAVVVVDPPAVVVVVVEPAPAAVVVVPPADEAGVAELSVGSFPLPALPLAGDEPPPVLPLIAIPTTAATNMDAKSCQVFHVRRSLILSSPGAGWPSDSSDGGSRFSEEEVIDPTPERPAQLDHAHSKRRLQLVIPFDPAVRIVARAD